MAKAFRSAWETANGCDGVRTTKAGGLVQPGATTSAVLLLGYLSDADFGSGNALDCGSACVASGSENVSWRASGSVNASCGPVECNYQNPDRHYGRRVLAVGCPCLYPFDPYHHVCSLA